MEGTTISGERRLSSKDRTMYQFDTDIIMRRPSKICASSEIQQTRIKSRVLLILLLAILLLPMSTLLFEDKIDSSISESSFHAAAEIPTLSLSYYSGFSSSFAPLASGDRIAGDHIILNATWTPRNNVNGTVIQVNASAIPSVIVSESNTSSVEIDTRLLGNNATCSVNVTTWLLNGTAITEMFTNVFFGNFFVPHVFVLTPNGGEKWPGQHNITWTAWDNNTDDSLSFEVLLSSDSGKSFQLMSSQLMDYWFMLDFAPFQNLSSYFIEVRVSDGIYTNSDKSDSSFTAGTVASSITSTNIETTTDSTATAPPDALDSRVALFIAAAIIASAILSLIVYHQAKRLS